MALTPAHDRAANPECRHFAAAADRAGEAPDAHKIGKARLGRDGERGETDDAEGAAFAIDAKDTDAPDAFSAKKGDRRRGGALQLVSIAGPATTGLFVRGGAEINAHCCA